jgi:hypothetical protein
MALFLDSADVKEAEQAMQMGFGCRQRC